MTTLLFSAYNSLAAVTGDSNVCDHAAQFYQDKGCCGADSGNVAQCVSPDVSTKLEAALAQKSTLSSCMQELLDEPDCAVHPFATSNFGSFDCRGQSRCSADNFNPHAPVFPNAEYEASLPASEKTGLMWARSAIDDGEFLFVQQSRTGNFGGQYGATKNHGRLQKISKATGAVVASIEMDNRWAPAIAKASDGNKYVFVGISHFMAHQDLNGIMGGTSNPTEFAGDKAAGRTGHWIYKLNYDDLSTVKRREVSVDHDLLEPRMSAATRTATDFSSWADVSGYLASGVGTTQLNFPLAQGAEESVCPGGEVLVSGISGYPYYYGFSDEAQNRPVGMFGQRNTGRGMGYCSNTLEPVWANPASNGWMQVPDAADANGDASDAATYLGAGKKRHLIVGDKIPAAKFRAGQTYTAVATEFPCDSASVTYPVNTVLADNYTFAISPVLAEFTVFNDLDVGEEVHFQPTAVNSTAIEMLVLGKTTTSMTVRLKGADFRDVAAGTTIHTTGATPVNVATVDALSKVGVDIVRVSESTASGARWSSTSEYLDLEYTVTADSITIPTAAICAAPTITADDPSTYPGFPPLIKKKKSLGDTIDNEGERVSLQQHGGSWWFRGSIGNGMFVTPQGNGHMESVDRYMAFRDFYLRRDALQNQIIADTDAVAQGTMTQSQWDITIAKRHDMIEERDAIFKTLSPVDYAGLESSVAAYSMATGERVWVASGEAPDVWNVDTANVMYSTLSQLTANGIDVTVHTDAVGYWSYLDIEANNAMVIGNKVVYTTKGSQVGTIDAATGDHINVDITALWPYKAEGTSASANFGGICYAGGDVVAVRGATNSFAYIHPITGAVIPADQAVLAGFNFKTGKIVWYQVTDETADSAHGLVCGQGLVYAYRPTAHAVGVYNAFTGAKLQDLAVPAGVASAYNNVQMVPDGRDLYMVTTEGVQKLSMTARTRHHALRNAIAPPRAPQGPSPADPTGEGPPAAPPSPSPVAAPVGSCPPVPTASAASSTCRSFNSLNDAQAAGATSNTFLLYKTGKSAGIAVSLDFECKHMGGQFDGMVEEDYASWVTRGGSHGSHAGFSSFTWEYTLSRYIIAVWDDSGNLDCGMSLSTFRSGMA